MTRMAFNSENTPKETNFYSDYSDPMRPALYGYFYKLTNQNLYTVENLYVMFVKYIPTISLTFQIQMPRNLLVQTILCNLQNTTQNL